MIMYAISILAKIILFRYLQYLFPYTKKYVNKTDLLFIYYVMPCSLHNKLKFTYFHCCTNYIYEDSLHQALQY